RVGSIRRMRILESPTSERFGDDTTPYSRPVSRVIQPSGGSFSSVPKARCGRAAPSARTRAPTMTVPNRITDRFRWYLNRRAVPTPGLHDRPRRGPAIGPRRLPRGSDSTNVQRNGDEQNESNECPAQLPDLTDNLRTHVRASSNSL